MPAKDEESAGPQLGSEKKTFIEKWLTSAQGEASTSSHSLGDNFYSKDSINKQHTFLNTVKSILFKKKMNILSESDSWTSTTEEEIQTTEGGDLVFVSTLDTGQLSAPGPRVIYNANKAPGNGRPTRGYSEIATRIPTSHIFSNSEKDTLTDQVDTLVDLDHSSDSWPLLIPIESSLLRPNRRSLILDTSLSYVRKIELVKKHMDQIVPRKTVSRRPLRLSESKISWRTTQSEKDVMSVNGSRVAESHFNSWTRELTGAPYWREQDRVRWQGQNREMWFRFNTLVKRHKNTAPVPVVSLKDRPSSLSDISLIQHNEATRIRAALIHLNSADSGVQTNKENSSQETKPRTAIWHAAINKVRETMAHVHHRVPEDHRRVHDLPLPKWHPPSRRPLPPDRGLVRPEPSTSRCHGYNNLPRPYSARVRQVR